MIQTTKSPEPKRQASCPGRMERHRLHEAYRAQKGGQGYMSRFCWSTVQCRCRCILAITPSCVCFLHTVGAEKAKNGFQCLRYLIRVGSRKLRATMLHTYRNQQPRSTASVHRRGLISADPDPRIAPRSSCNSHHLPPHGNTVQGARQGVHKGTNHPRI